MTRATIYLDEDLHQALKMQAAAASTSISNLVNDAVRASLAEDAEDLESFRVREDEPSVDFESFVRKLKKDGKL